MLFGAAYYPEHRDPSRWEHDLDLMAGAAVNALRIGEFAWKRFEPRPGEYDFDWLEQFTELARPRGIQLLLCPPLRTAPAWLVEQHPDILIVDDQGRRLGFGSRYTFCINNQALLDAGAALAAEMAKRFGGSENLIGWHLDNEHGDQPDCHCETCRGEWHTWLRERYDGNIERLNAAWGTVFWGLEFNDFAQVPTPRVTKASHSPALWLNWRRFYSECNIKAMRVQVDALRAAGATEPITTNHQNLWNVRTDYYQAAKLLDIAGTNYYPPYGDNCRKLALAMATTRSYQDGRPFEVHELRNGPHLIPGAGGNTPGSGEMTRLTLHAIGNGADATYYFRWRACPFGPEQTHGTLTGYDGQPLRAYGEAKVIGKRLRRLADMLDGTTVRSDVAILWDYPTRWLMETGVHWEGPGVLYRDRATLLYASLRTRGINVDAVGRDRDWSRYRVLVVPFLAATDEAVIEKLVAFVASGGTLLLHPHCGERNEEGVFFPTRLHPKLETLLGVSVRDHATSANEAHRMSWRGRDYCTGLLMNLPEVSDAAVEATYADDWFAKRAAMTRRNSGDGQAIYLATLPARAFYDAFFDALLDDRNVPRILGKDVPQAVEIIERSGDDGRRLVFLLNCTAEPQSVAIPSPMHDVWQEEDLSVAAELPPHGSRILMAPETGG